MTDPEPPAKLLEELLNESIMFARNSERLRAALASLHPVADAIKDVHDLDPALGPELGVAAGHLQALTEALDRAFTFQSSRYEVALERIRGAVT